MPEEVPHEEAESAIEASDGLDASAELDESPAQADVAAEEAADSATQQFKPPSVLDALRGARFGSRPPRQRPKAQPATGTAEDAAAVTYIDARERRIGGFLAVFEVILGVLGFLAARSYVEHASKTISRATAHADTLRVQHAAPWVLGISLVLAAFTGLAVLSKRRAAVGFTLLLTGLATIQYGGIVTLFGFVYIGVGLWMVFRSMKRRSQAASRDVASTRGARGGARSTSAQTGGASRKASAAPAKPPATVSSRYTPPRPRKPVPKPEVKPEPEKENRLASWLKR